jgi:penicillin-binding protein 2
MYIEKQKLSKQEIRRKSFIANIIVTVLFTILIFAFWNSQVLKNNYYNVLANQNIIKEIEVKAPRGFVLDRNHIRLAENKLNFTLFLNREYSKIFPRTLNAAASIIGKDSNDIIKKIEKFKNHPESFLIPLEKNVPLEKVIYIESRSDEFPEFKIEIEPARAYPYKEVASHILGYISELTTDELGEKRKEKYALGDIVGKSGIERQYEPELRGSKGSQMVARDNEGRIREMISEKKPIIGNSVVLTIDIELQKYVEEIFGDNNGAVGIVELKTGDILALVSKPNFNPEFFSGVLDPEEWQVLVNDPNKPLQNKSLQGFYSPGSIFKIVVALAGLQEKYIDESFISQCSGFVKIYDQNFHCWMSGGHGALNVVGALKNSCNIFFYRVGKRLDIDLIAKYAKLLGLGDKTGIDLPNEKKGLIPTKEWRLNTMSQKWFPGETISVAIGGGMLNITPIQALQMISTVALRGLSPKLHILKSIEKDGQVIKTFKPEFQQIPIDKENFEIVIEGLYQVVNDGGTGHAAKVPGLDVCGKTGTQQVISKENPNYSKLVKQKKSLKPHAWFVSFAPRENPQIAMVIFIEHGGDAGSAAAPLASIIYKKIFKK